MTSIGDIKDLKLSMGKREKLRKEAKKKAVEEMKAALPGYDLDQIRRARLKYHEAVLINLEERNFPNAADFLKQIIEIQEEQILEAGPENYIDGSRLIDNNEMLDKFANGLVRAEDAHSKENFKAECDEFIKMACFFAFGNSGWWWLGAQLFEQCMGMTAEYTGDGGQREAAAKFLFGKFLFENVADVELAKDLIEIAREMSNGTQWNVRMYLRGHNMIFTEANYLLYQYHLKQAQNLMRWDAESAARMAEIARKRAAEACSKEGVTQALLLQGICEMISNKSSVAIGCLTKAFAIQAKLNCEEGMAESRIQLALAYLKNGNTVMALKHLMKLKESAENNIMPYYVAQAYRYLGEYNLSNDEPDKATPILMVAMRLFRERNYLRELEEVRNLAAISQGQEMMLKYTDLILKAGKPGAEGANHMAKLLKWKNLREPFWDSTDVESEISTDSKMYEDILETFVDAFKERRGTEIKKEPSTSFSYFDYTLDEIDVIVEPDEVTSERQQRSLSKFRSGMALAVKSKSKIKLSSRSSTRTSSRKD